MNTNKNEMLSVEDVSTALKISKSQVYKILKKNKNIIKPMIKVDGKTFISRDGIEYIEKVFNKTIGNIDNDGMAISLEEIAVTLNTKNPYKNNSLEDINLKDDKDTAKLTESNIQNISAKQTMNAGIDEINNLSKDISNEEKKQKSCSEEIYVTPINFQGEITFEENESINNAKISDNLTEDERLRAEEEKLLEKHCREVDTKLINLKERLIEKQQLNKKSFFKKVIGNIFKGN